MYSVSLGLRLITALLFISIFFHSQPGHTQVLPMLGESVVTATRFDTLAQDLPIGVTVINEEQIRNSTASTVPELLRRFAGVTIRNNTGSPNQQVDLRGFGVTGDQNTLILLDGQRISENELASVNWAAISLSVIERIEIMRGSGAVLYGPGATGGTINIITKAPQKNKSAYLGAGFGSYDTAEYRAGFNLGSENVGLIVQGNHLETDNYRAYNRLRQQNAQADLRWSGSRATLYAKLGADDQQLLLPGALKESEIAVDRHQAVASRLGNTHTSGGHANLGGTLKLGDAELALNAAYRGKTASAAYFGGTSLTNTQVGVTSLAPRAKIPFTFGGMRHTLIAGVDSEYSDYDSSIGPIFMLHRLATQRDTGYYVHTGSAVTPTTLLALGVRLHSSRFGVDELIGATSDTRNRNLRAFEVALRQTLSAGVAVYAKFGNSFRIPNVDDNFSFFTGGVNLLEPQTSHDREIGTELKLGRGDYRLALYHMDVNNEIHLDPFGGDNINLPPTRRYGAELEGKWLISDSVNAYANYTYAVAEFREGAFGGVSVVGKRVPLVPRHKLNLGATWRLLPQTTLNTEMSYTGTQKFDGDETNSFGRDMPSYTLLDMKLNHEVAGWLLSAGVKNLFNQKYFSYGLLSFPSYAAYPEPGRSVFVSAQYVLGKK